MRAELCTVGDSSTTSGSRLVSRRVPRVESNVCSNSVGRHGRHPGAGAVDAWSRVEVRRLRPPAGGDGHHARRTATPPTGRPAGTNGASTTRGRRLRPHRRRPTPHPRHRRQPTPRRGRPARTLPARGRGLRRRTHRLPAGADHRHPRRTGHRPRRPARPGHRPGAGTAVLGTDVGGRDRARHRRDHCRHRPARGPPHRDPARDRCVDVVVEDGSGLATVFATLFAPNAKAFDARVSALADTVCPADPRTKDNAAPTPSAPSLTAPTGWRASAIPRTAPPPSPRPRPESWSTSSRTRTPSTGRVDRVSRTLPDQGAAQRTSRARVRATTCELTTRPRRRRRTRLPPRCATAPSGDNASGLHRLDTHRRARQPRRRPTPTLHQAVARADPDRSAHPTTGPARLHPTRGDDGRPTPARSDARRAAHGATPPHRPPRTRPTRTPLPTSKKLADFVRCRDRRAVPGLPNPGQRLRPRPCRPWPTGRPRRPTSSRTCRRHHC